MIEPNILIFPKPNYQNIQTQYNKIKNQIIYIDRITKNHENKLNNFIYVSTQTLSKRYSTCVQQHYDLNKEIIQQNNKSNIINQNPLQNISQNQSKFFSNNININMKNIPFNMLQNKSKIKIINQLKTARQIFNNDQEQFYTSIKHKKNSNKIYEQNTIPALLIQDKFNNKQKIGLYYHANAEDIFNSYQFVKKISLWTQMDILLIQYPGYSIYKTQKTTSAQKILDDIPSIMKFLTIKGYKNQNIFVIGRSIGTAPAIFISKNYNIGGLLLLSPFTSFTKVVENLYGSIASFVSKQIFNNIQICSQIKCPVLIIHGLMDKTINFQHSIQLITKIKTYCQLKLIPDMTHNKFNHQKDFLIYLTDFLFQINFK